MTISSPPHVSSQQYPWTPDLSNGRYRNPIISADYPDPDVIRDGDDYYMTASSFHVVPGLPILHSRDLVNWKLINHALRRLPARYDAVVPGCAVWAPSIRKHAGKFWIFFGMPDEGLFHVTAEDPAGEWSEPHLVQAGPGLIDPCPLWDDNGKAYLVHAYAFSRCGIKHKLRVRPMAPDGSRLLGEGQIVFDDPANHPTVEGPKFMKAHGYYYILAPAGGVESGWQLALRSKHVYGPYEHKIVLEQGASPINGPHQGGLVDTPRGDWWFLHFQDTKPYGRIPHLQPARWVDEWPLMGVDHDENRVGKPVLEHAKPKTMAKTMAEHVVPATSDEFDNPRLGEQWHWHANPQDGWHTLSARPGWLRLHAQPAACRFTREIDRQDGPVEERTLAHIPHLLLQKFPARAFDVQTHVELSPHDPTLRAGIAVVGRKSAALLVRHDTSRLPGTGLIVECILNERIVEHARLPGMSAVLLVRVREGGLCTFGYQSADGTMEFLSPEFEATEGVWVGAKIGLVALQQSGPIGVAEPFAKPGHADFGYLRFAPPGMSRDLF